MIENIWPLIGALILGIITVIFARKTRPPKKIEMPPKNRAADAARATIQQTFDEEIDGVWTDLAGNDPAGDLADEGNARDR